MDGEDGATVGWACKVGRVWRGADVDVDKYGLSHPRRMVGWAQADQIVQEPTRKIGVASSPALAELSL